MEALRPYLVDADPAVRAAAVAALGETVPAGAGPALAERLRDSAPQVRAAAAAALRELVEVLPAEADLGAGLREALGGPDPAVRAAVLDVLRALRLGDAGVYAAALADTDMEVRITAVRSLVSVDSVTELAVAATDPAGEVRVAVARGLAAVHAPAPAPLDPLLDDADSLVRGAALAALAATGCPPHYAALAAAALDHSAWQVRAGAATAQAVPALAKALADPNADVRKAAVLSLIPHRADAEARTALATLTTDPDADIRAYASRAVS
ncbi:HEAT repeat domain-containing protein [Streptomyces sp. NPDC057136]|uniref:HEAT repeat domain-containing protein n=1 Tax=Streptomyces sp. NPDC057136 TaxID=3346029 RepID=UPI00363BA981